MWSAVGDRLVRTNPRNIMVERDFYRLDAIPRRYAEIPRMLLFREETSAAMRRTHGNFVVQFRLVSEVLEKVLGHLGASADDKAYARKVAIEIEERLSLCSWSRRRGRAAGPLEMVLYYPLAPRSRLGWG